MPTDFLQSMYRRRPANRPLSPEDVEKVAAYQGQIYASMRDELEKISVLGAKLVGPKKDPHTVVELEPGSMRITKVGSIRPLRGVVPKMFSKLRSKFQAGTKAFKQTTGPTKGSKPGLMPAPTSAKPKVTRRPKSKPGWKLPAAMVGIGLAAGGASIGAGKVLSQHARQQQQGGVPPFYQ